MDSISDNKRIAKNTIMLYIRMIVMMLISLFTTRIVLQVLGVADLGIVNVVGGIVSLITMISSSMTLTVQRFISYDLGKRDIEELNKTFSTAVLLHVVLALFVVAIGETVGLYFLKHHINYPEERAEAVMWVYQLSLLTACIGITQIPYSALIVAYEKMGIYAYFTISDVILKLLSVYLLWVVPFDKLIFFSLFHTTVAILMMEVYRIYCRRQFLEVRFRFGIHKEKFKHLTNFAGWSAFGELAWAGTNQGVTIILNMFFGPAVNAARGIGFQIQSAVIRFVSAFQTAINPQIIKLYAAGNILQMQKLVHRGTCLSVYLTLLLSLPVILEPDYLIYIWLGQVPEHVVVFTQLVLINIMLDMLSNLLPTVVKAYGKISAYQMIVSMVLGLNFPLSYLAFYFGLPAYSSFVVYSGISVALLGVRLILIRKMMGISIREYMLNVLWSVVKVCALALPLPIYVSMSLEDSFVNVAVVAFVSVLCVAFAVYTLGLYKGEKEILKMKLRDCLSTFIRK